MDKLPDLVKVRENESIYLDDDDSVRRRPAGVFFLSFLLFFGMILEVFGLGILVPALNVIIDPQALDTNSLISNIKDFFPQLSDNDFAFNFLIFSV